MVKGDSEGKKGKVPKRKKRTAPMKKKRQRQRGGRKERSSVTMTLPSGNGTAPLKVYVGRGTTTVEKEFDSAVVECTVKGPLMEKDMDALKKCTTKEDFLRIASEVEEFNPSTLRACVDSIKTVPSDGVAFIQ